MPSFKATLGDGFPVVISYDIDADGDIPDVSVSTVTGLCLDDLIYATPLHDRAWALAIEHKPAPCARWLRESA